MSYIPHLCCSSAASAGRYIPHISKKNEGTGVEITPVQVKAVSETRTMVRKCNPCRAFTLVEVVLAIGIIALAFVPVLGLLPVGANVAKEAIDTTVEAQINQQMTNQVQQTDFSTLRELAKDPTLVPTQFFDYQGNKLAVDKAENAIYEAWFNVLDGTQLPGSATTTQLATVTICILNTKTRAATAESDMMKNPAAKKFAILVPNNGR